MVHYLTGRMNKRIKANGVHLQPLGEQVYDLIKSDVILCNLTPGEEFTEVALAEHYGFGRAPVRTALLKLGQEGLVSVVPRRGYSVSPITVQGVQEIFDLRLVLEPRAVRAAVGNINIQKLRSFNSHPSMSDSGPQNLRFLKSNREFHIEIINACGNHRLVRILSGLFDEMDRLLHLGLFSERDAIVMRVNHEEQGQQHDAIIAALAAEDPAAAEVATRVHIEGSRDLVLKAIMSGRLAFSL